jgi:hypothetical protein
MEKTNKTTKKSPSRLRVSKVYKILLPLALIVPVLAFVAGMFIQKKKSMEKVTMATNDKTFCMGIDPATNDEYAIRLSVNIKDNGHVRVFKTTKNPEGSPKMVYQDLVAGIDYQGPGGFADRLHLRLSGDENLQIYRECGIQPTCRLELMHQSSVNDIAKAKIEINKLKKEIALANKNLKKKKAIWVKTKKRGGKKLLAATFEMEKYKSQVRNLTDEIEKAQKLVSSEGPEIQKIPLNPINAKEWCASANL